MQLTVEGEYNSTKSDPFSCIAVTIYTEWCNSIYTIHAVFTLFMLLSNGSILFLMAIHWIPERLEECLKASQTEKSSVKKADMVHRNRAKDVGACLLPLSPLHQSAKNITIIKRTIPRT